MLETTIAKAATFTVPSRTRANVEHTVTFDIYGWRCTCEWGQYRWREQRQCWHVEAVQDRGGREFAWKYFGESCPSSLHRDYHLRQWAKQMSSSWSTIGAQKSA